MKSLIRVKWQTAAAALICAAQALCAQTPVKDVLAQIDPATGKAKDTATEFSVSGVIAAKLVLPDQKVLAFVHNPGEPALTVLADAQDGAGLLPRNVVKLAGKLGEGPFGAALVAAAGGVSVVESNKPFTSASVAGALFKDASAMAGRYVQLTNVTFAAAKFDASGTAKVKCADDSEVTLAVGKGAFDHEVPAGATDVFGVVVKAGDGWRLVAARFLPVNRKECQELATLRTCLSCHNPDVRNIGPAYREVAAKYRNDPNAISTFIAQMENGGTGKWGTNVMVSLKTLVPPQEMKTLANWVFGYRWDALLAE
ncbi:MAG TPA: c-type cytochrome [Candidatus Paceibacterota bacterium]|nr:c-type cytochrome [Candidatus Paceibacterota bacterium]